MNRKLLVSVWRCGGKLYRSYTDGTVDILNMRYYSIPKQPIRADQLFVSSATGVFNKKDFRE